MKFFIQCYIAKTDWLSSRANWFKENWCCEKIETWIKKSSHSNDPLQITPSSHDLWNLCNYLSMVTSLKAYSTFEIIWKTNKDLLELFCVILPDTGFEVCQKTVYGVAHFMPTRILIVRVTSQGNRKIQNFFIKTVSAIPVNWSEMSNDKKFQRFLLFSFHVLWSCLHLVVPEEMTFKHVPLEVHAINPWRNCLSWPLKRFFNWRWRLTVN